jgi:hypothetical protein
MLGDPALVSGREGVLTRNAPSVVTERVVRLLNDVIAEISNDDARLGDLRDLISVLPTVRLTTLPRRTGSHYFGAG